MKRMGTHRSRKGGAAAARADSFELGKKLMSKMGWKDGGCRVPSCVVVVYEKFVFFGGPVFENFWRMKGAMFIWGV